MLKYFVGVDLGTGSTKAVAVDADGSVLYTSQKHYPTSNPQPGYSEQNPCLIWDAFVFCINDVTATIGSIPVAVSFSAAMHSVMAINSEGEPLSNAIQWADARSGDIAQSIRDSTQGEDIYRHTGTAIYAMSPLCKIIWWRNNDYPLYNNAHKFISIKEYIWYKLFGVFEIDHSIASATGLFDILALDWYDQAMALAGLTPDKLSVPVATKHSRSSHLLSTVFKDITAETKFVIGASDGCCANLSGNAIQPGIGAITIGTSGAVRIGSDEPIYNFEAMTFNYLLDENTFICGGAVNNGGAALDWLLQNFLKLTDITTETYEGVFGEIDKVKPGSNGLLFLPYLYAERAPVWDAKSSGAFLNIRFSHSREHFLRAGLEGICFALNDVLSAVQHSLQPIDEIVISGGFISSKIWVQMLADITGKRLVVQQTEDASAIGAIYLAMSAFGVDIDVIREKDAGHRQVTEPNMTNHGIYNQTFAVYQKLYKNLKESMHLMHNLNN
ncbi:gluconokinase [Mucilaginibacter glaciei]|uniref:Gluconokinase n=1 Tax=Mucilaginibacter glaciei TaxID=2772109 RepID=A0A926NMC6_9SPHI|nr:gluconokinase [Mucilaginibacter glaciei]MBD1391863.1 gluconokinase [Mucilaginibacter glaciei]